MKMVVDKAGRAVIPKPIRERMGLRAGTELQLRVEDGELIATPGGPQVVLVEENGRLVLSTTEPVPTLTNEEMVDFIHRMREERMDHVLHAGDPNAECHHYD